MKVIVNNFGKKAPEGLSTTLRDLADRVDAGNVTDMVLSYVDNDHYEFVYAASKINCIVMSSMLQRECLDRMKNVY